MHTLMIRCDLSLKFIFSSVNWSIAVPLNTQRCFRLGLFLFSWRKMLQGLNASYSIGPCSPKALVIIKLPSVGLRNVGLVHWVTHAHYDGLARNGPKAFTSSRCLPCILYLDRAEIVVAVTKLPRRFWNPKSRSSA